MHLRNQALIDNRNQFNVLAVERDEPSAHALAEEIIAFGYPRTASIPASMTLEKVLDDPPHILICDYEAPSEIEEFLVSLQDASPETLVILLTRAEQSLLAFELIAKGLAYDSAVRPLVSKLELSQKVDRAASELYHLFETEQLRDFMLKKKPQAAGSNSASSGGDELALNDYLSRLASTKDLDETTQVFIETVSNEWGGAQCLYFKYLASHASMALSQAAGLSVEKYRGFGIDLKKETLSHLPDFFKAPEKSEPLRKFIKEVFNVSEFTAFTHSNESEVVGLFVTLTHSREDILSPHSRTLSLKRIFELAYKKNVTLREKHALDMTDALTGLLNRRHFAKRLEEEISRARRIVMPLSLITIDCDRFHQINEKIGFQQADTILKVLAAVLKKTTRVSDVIARTGPDEFALLLPHTGQNGAAIKAERLRILIESTKFPILGSSAGTMTLSCGVSEYPSLSSDAEGLLRSADDALAQVRKSGNRVCMATVAPDFKKDFIPREISAEDSAIKR